MAASEVAPLEGSQLPEAEAGADADRPQPRGAAGRLWKVAKKDMRLRALARRMMAAAPVQHQKEGKFTRDGTPPVLGGGARLDIADGTVFQYVCFSGDCQSVFIANISGSPAASALNLQTSELSQPIPDTESEELSEKVYEIVQGRVFEMALKHDASRAIQAVFQRGTKKHRSAMIAELKGHLRDLCMSKYGRQVLLKIMRVSVKDKVLLAPMFGELLGFTRKLLTHKVAGAVIDCMYGEAATPEQRGRMVLDCCGREVSMLFDEAAGSVHLTEIFDKHPKKKSAVLGRIHDLLLTLVQKQSIQSQLGLHLLCEYIKHAEHVDRMDVLAGVAPLCEPIVEAGGSKEAESALFELLSYSGAKERKAVMKSLKGNWGDIALREHGHRVVMRALDVIDDTTMLRKTVVADLLDDAKITELCTHKYGRRVLLHLLAPRDTTFFDQYTINIMQPTFVPAGKDDGEDGGEGRMVPTSKKDPDTRRRELLPEVAPKLLAWCTKNASATLCRATTADVCVALLKQTELGSFLKGDGAETVTACLKALAEATIAPRSDAKKGLEGLAASACNDYVGRKTIRRLLELPSVGAEFGALLLETLSGELLLECATLRGGRFVIEALLISEHSMTKDAVVGTLRTKDAEAAMSACDEGVLKVLGPLLGLTEPAAEAKPAAGGKRKGKSSDVTPPTSAQAGEEEDDNGKKKKKKKTAATKTKKAAKGKGKEEEEVPVVRKSRRLAK
eukprot:COSAG06_NODE_1769_length_8430_cov_3.135518_3_plen_731_part_00